MDFTRLEENAREGHLNFGEAVSLVNFYEFQHKPEEEASTHDYNPQNEESVRDLCWQLSTLYPGVSFEFTGHGINAKVEEGIDSSLVELFGFVNKDTPYFTTNIFFGSESIRVVFRADGTGVINNDWEYEFFKHDLDLEEIKREQGDEESIANCLEEYFHKEISDQFEDPFFEPSDEDCPIYFEKGSQAELERAIKLFILTEPDIEEYEDEFVEVYAGVNDESPRLPDYGSYYSERLEKLIEIATAENYFYGYTWEYNDGPIDRRSGYNKSPQSRIWNIDNILSDSLPREKMAARRQLRMWLNDRGHDPAEFGVQENRT